MPRFLLCSRVSRLTEIRLPRPQRCRGGPIFTADIVGERRAKIAEDSLKRDPNQDLVGHAGPFESFGGGFVDHCFAIARFHHVEKLQVQRGVHRAHLRAADVAGKTPARQYCDFAVIVVTNVIATGQSEADRSQVIDNRYARLSVWSR